MYLISQGIAILLKKSFFNFFNGASQKGMLFILLAAEVALKAWVEMMFLLGVTRAT
jgi:hypothetical protein